MKTTDPEFQEVVAELTGYQQALYGFIYVQLGDRQAANDVLQDANLSILKNIERLDSAAHFKPWAKTMAAYEILHYRTRRARESRRIFFDSAAVDRLAESLAAPEERSAADDIPFDALEACLGKLPPEKREFVKRRYWGRESLSSLAGADAPTPGAAAVRLLRIRKELADCVRRLVCRMGGTPLPPPDPDESTRALLL